MIYFTNIPHKNNNGYLRHEVFTIQYYGLDNVVI